MERLNLKFQTRIALLLVTTCVVLSSVLITLSLAQSSAQRQADIKELKTHLYNNYDTVLKTQVQGVMSVLQSLDDKVNRGEISKERAQADAKAILKKWHYMENQSGHFWVDTVSGINILQAETPEVEGKQRIDAKDANGKPFVREMIEQGRKLPGGFTEFFWRNTPTESAHLKRVYSLEYKPWGWVVSTGGYVNDIEANIRANEDSIKDSIRDNIFKCIIITILFAGISVLIATSSIHKEVASIGGDPEKDALTGSLSRMKLMKVARDRRKRMMSQHKCLSIALLDIDHFKKINDTYGHQIGDRALQHISTICLQTLRSTDYFGRYGGEEFLFVFPNANAKIAFGIADRIRGEIEDTPLILEDGRTIEITVSMGTATLYPNKNHESIEHLIARADKALYWAKGNGRNRVGSADVIETEAA